MSLSYATPGEYDEYCQAQLLQYLKYHDGLLIPTSDPVEAQQELSYLV